MIVGNVQIGFEWSLVGFSICGKSKNKYPTFIGRFSICRKTVHFHPNFEVFLDIGRQFISCIEKFGRF